MRLVSDAVKETRTVQQYERRYIFRTIIEVGPDVPVAINLAQVSGSHDLDAIYS